MVGVASSPQQIQNKSRHLVLVVKFQIKGGGGGLSRASSFHVMHWKAESRKALPSPPKWTLVSLDIWKGNITWRNSQFWPFQVHLFHRSLLCKFGLAENFVFWNLYICLNIFYGWLATLPSLCPHCCKTEHCEQASSYLFFWEGASRKMNRWEKVVKLISY